MDRLREGVSAGLLTVDEFEERLDAAYSVTSTEELHAPVGGLPTPPRQKNRRITGAQKAMLGSLAFAVGAIVVGATHSSGGQHGPSQFTVASLRTPVWRYPSKPPHTPSAISANTPEATTIVNARLRNVRIHSP